MRDWGYVGTALVLFRHGACLGLPRGISTRWLYWLRVASVFGKPADPPSAGFFHPAEAVCLAGKGGRPRGGTRLLRKAFVSVSDNGTDATPYNPGSCVRT